MISLETDLAIYHSVPKFRINKTKMIPTKLCFLMKCFLSPAMPLCLPLLNSMYHIKRQEKQEPAAEMRTSKDEFAVQMRTTEDEFAVLPVSSVGSRACNACSRLRRICRIRENGVYIGQPSNATE